jgi:hypothetical protein
MEITIIGAAVFEEPSYKKNIEPKAGGAEGYISELIDFLIKKKLK